MLRSRDRKTLVGFVAMLSFLVGCSGNEVANLADPAGDLGTLDPPQFVSLTNSATEVLDSGTAADAQTAQDVADSVSALVAGGSLEVLTMPGTINGDQLLGTNSSPAVMSRRLIASAKAASEVPEAAPAEIASDATVGGGDDDSSGSSPSEGSGSSETAAAGSTEPGSSEGPSDPGPSIETSVTSESSAGAGDTDDDESEVGGFGSVFASAGSNESEGGPSAPEILRTLSDNAGGDEDDDDGPDGPTFTEADGAVTITDDNGLSLTFNPAILTRNENNRPTSLAISSPLTVTGTLPTDVQHRDVNLVIQGISGNLNFPESRHDDPELDFTVGTAVGVAGSVGGIAGDIVLSGVLGGPLTTPDAIPGMLAGPALEVVVSRLVIPDRIARLALTARLSNLHIPTGDESGGPTFESLTGTLDLWAEPGLGEVIEGGIERVQAFVESDRPLVLSGANDGPDSGRVTVELSRANRRVDRLEVTFDQGKAQVAGRVINACGEEETVITDGSTVRVEGKARFQNGRTSSHSVTLDRDQPGNLTFEVMIKDAEGAIVLQLAGSLQSDGTIRGTWSRPLDSLTGIFYSTAEGQIVVENDTGGRLARATPPADWNENLDQVARTED